jgi:methylated-DNA-[protein]-cysteine S-methyltransferase
MTATAHAPGDRERIMSTPIARPRAQYAYLFATDLGVCGIAWSRKGITRLQLPEANARATGRRLAHGGARRADGAPPADVRKVIAEVQRYCAGASTDFDEAVLDLSAVGEFYRRVYEAARAIGWGRTATYGELARRVNSPGAARGVGQAMGRNPVPIIIPCHRILASGNKIGGFSAFGGTATKERLLALEGIGVRDQHPTLPGLLPADR